MAQKRMLLLYTEWGGRQKGRASAEGRPAADSLPSLRLKLILACAGRLLPGRAWPVSCRTKPDLNLTAAGLASARLKLTSNGQLVEAALRQGWATAVQWPGSGSGLADAPCCTACRNSAPSATHASRQAAAAAPCACLLLAPIASQPQRTPAAAAASLHRPNSSSTAAAAAAHPAAALCSIAPLRQRLQRPTSCCCCRLTAPSPPRAPPAPAPLASWQAPARSKRCASA